GDLHRGRPGIHARPGTNTGWVSAARAQLSPDASRGRARRGLRDGAPVAGSAVRRPDEPGTLPPPWGSLLGLCHRRRRQRTIAMSLARNAESQTQRGVSTVRILRFMLNGLVVISLVVPRLSPRRGARRRPIPRGSPN